MYVCMYDIRRYCLMPVIGDVMKKERIEEKRWFLSCSKAEVKPGIFNQSRRCESSKLGLTNSSVAGIQCLKFHTIR